MPKHEGQFQSWSPTLLSILRIVSAFMFFQHGSAKLFHVPHVAMFDGVQLMSLIGVAGILEVVGGLMLLIGLFTRPIAFILSGEMAFAYFIEHFPQSFFPLLNDGSLAIVFCFGCLYLAATGGGPLSLDSLLGSGSRLQPDVSRTS